jgi:hypothetical protein
LLGCAFCDGRECQVPENIVSFETGEQILLKERGLR